VVRLEVTVRPKCRDYRDDQRSPEYILISSAHTEPLMKKTVRLEQQSRHPCCEQSARSHWDAVRKRSSFSVRSRGFCENARQGRRDAERLEGVFDAPRTQHPQECY